MARVKANISVDSDVWKRCKALSDRLPFINWSEIAEASFMVYLVMFEEVIGEMPDDAEGAEIVIQKILLHLQSKYYEALSDVYAAPQSVQINLPKPDSKK